MALVKITDRMWLDISKITFVLALDVLYYNAKTLERQDRPGFQIGFVDGSTHDWSYEKTESRDEFFAALTKAIEEHQKL